MPRVIVKCRYYSPKSRKDIGGMLTYIATREGVEKPVEKTYLDYMATRPRAERISGLHGLFSQAGKEIDLTKSSKDVSAFNGNIFTVIISVSRDDAERLGFNNANRWRDMIRAKISDVAKAHDIPLEDLEWYGAFHNESHHPHVHLLLYSKNENYPGFIKRKNIDDLRRTFGKAIFADEQFGETKARVEIEIAHRQRLFKHIPHTLLRIKQECVGVERKHTPGEALRNADLKFHITVVACGLGANRGATHKVIVFVNAEKGAIVEVAEHTVGIELFRLLHIHNLSVSG